MPIRLQLLQALVQRRWGLTKREMAGLLGKSIRQIERYLQQLRSAGIPLVSDGEANDGVALRWRIDRSDFLGLPSEVPPLDFSLTELFLLVAALESAELPECGWLDETRRALLDKIALYQPLRGLRQIPILRECITTHGPRQARSDSVAQNVMNTVLEGMTRGACLKISYPWYKGKIGERLIEPISIVLVRGAYYCLVRVRPHADLRLLKMSRISRARLSSESFDPPEGAALRDHLNQSFGLWQEAPRQVAIRFDAQTSAIIRMMRIHESQKIEANEDGTCVLNLLLGGRQEILWWILQWGDHAELLEPEDWRAELVSTINRMTMKYSEKGADENDSD